MVEEPSNRRLLQALLDELGLSDQEFLQDLQAASEIRKLQATALASRRRYLQARRRSAQSSPETPVRERSRLEDTGAAGGIGAALGRAGGWLIESLFPRRPGLGLSTMGPRRTRDVEDVREYTDARTGMTVRARKRERAGGLTSELEVLVRDASGAPLSGLTVTLSPGAGPSRVATTDSAGRARFPGLRNVDADRWKLEIGR
jgi:hypothetical protein